MARHLLLPILAAACAITAATAGAAPQATRTRRAAPAQRATHPAPHLETAPMTMTLTSRAFPPLGDMPARFTGDGADVSPPLAWSGTPAGARSLALVVDDPDAPDPAAPRVDWVHWVIYDLPVSADSLPEGLTRRSLPPGTREGLNDWKAAGWRGPSPPRGKHRYFHRLYALDVVLPDLHSPSRAALERAMKGHVLARGELVGMYARR